MSIYSGFATRQQQQTYDKCTKSLIQILQRRIIKFYTKQSADEDKFINAVSSLQTQMKKMEAHKYLQPKLSFAFEDIFLFLQNYQDFPNQILQAAQIYQSEKDEANLKCKQQTSSNTETKQKETFISRQVSVKSHRFGKSNDRQRSSIDERPSTTNKVRKRTNKSFRLGSQTGKGNFFDLSPHDIQNIAEIYKSKKIDRHNTNLNPPPIQNLINLSQSKAFKVSRNQPRTYFGSTQKIKQRRFSQKSREQISSQNINFEEYDPDIKQLIKGYINRSKKNYMKGSSGKKEQIDDIIKLI